METKLRIKKKADELFRRYGIRTVTMDEIASQLGISKKTIYQAFADKQQLVDEVITDLLEYNQVCCNRDQSIAKDAVHEVLLAMEMMQEMFSNMNNSILFDLERNHAETYKKFKDFKYHYLLDVLRKNIERGKTEQLYRQEIDTEVIARLRLESIMLAFNPEVFPQNKFSFVAIQKQMIEYFLFGVANLQGHKLIIKYQKGLLKNSAK